MGKVLHASYSGFFPFCIDSQRENPNIAGSLAAIMALFWRVKKIKFVSKLDDVGLVETIIISSATKEEDIVCAGSVWLYEKSDYILNPTQLNFNNVQENGTSMRAGFSLESPLSEVFWNYSFDFGGVSKNLIIGETGLSVAWNTTASENSEAVSVEATEFWSYGGTYNTQTGSKYI